MERAHKAHRRSLREQRLEHGPGIVNVVFPNELDANLRIVVYQNSNWLEREVEQSSLLFVEVACLQRQVNVGVVVPLVLPYCFRPLCNRDIYSQEQAKTSVRLNDKLTTKIGPLDLILNRLASGPPVALASPFVPLKMSM